MSEEEVNVVLMTPTAESAVNDLRRAVEASWSQETSNAPERWSPENRAFGQCAVTALVVQDYLGGALLRTVVGDVSHYWNELSDGFELDLTRHQFKQYVPEGREYRVREYVLSSPDTARRYVRLLALVAEHLEDERGRGAKVASPVQLEHP